MVSHGFTEIPILDLVLCSASQVFILDLIHTESANRKLS